MPARTIKKVVAAELPLPFTPKVIRLYFNPKPLMDALREKKFDNTGMRNSENDIFTEALYDYAVAALGKEEVDRCLKMR